MWMHLVISQTSTSSRLQMDAFAILFLVCIVQLGRVGAISAASDTPGKVAHNSPAQRVQAFTARMLCDDHDTSCFTSQISCQKDRNVKYNLCKAACGACPSLSVLVTKDTGIPVQLHMRDPSMLGCKDKVMNCKAQAAQGNCQTQPSDMLQSCQATCKFCSPSLVEDALSGICTDDIDVCPYFASTGLCEAGLVWPHFLCKKSCGLCDRPPVMKLLRSIHNPVPELECVDYINNCQVFAAAGKCKRNRNYMAIFCRNSCSLCHVEMHNSAGYLQYKIRPEMNAWKSLDTSCKDRHTMCSMWTAMGACFANKKTSELCPRSCGFCRQQGTSGYLSMTKLRVGCTDGDSRCADWAKNGECDSNPGFMFEKCQNSCGLCDVFWTTSPLPTLTIAPKVTMPSIGFGTAGLGIGRTRLAVLDALAVGYRLIDSAQASEWYAEHEVGNALQQSDVDRQEIFLTSKLHPRHLGYNTTILQLKQSLHDLHTNYLDLFLLHYPECWGDMCKTKPEGTWQDSWRALEFLHQNGKVRAIGVSNFNLQQMHELLKFATVKPAVLQANSDPLNPNYPLQTFCRIHGIQFQAYSSLGTQWLSKFEVNPVLTADTITITARKLGVSPAMVVLRWALQHGQAIIPRSSNSMHMKANLQVLGFSLDHATMLAIDSLEKTNSAVI